MAAVLLLRAARPVSPLPSLCVRQPAVRTDSLHRLLWPGLGGDRAAHGAARASCLRSAELRHRVWVDLRRPPDGCGHDRVCGRRGAHVLRRLPARLHELRSALSGRGRPGAADCAGAPGHGGRSRAGCRGGGPRLLLIRVRPHRGRAAARARHSVGRRIAVAVIAISIALIPHAASAHALLLQSDPAPGSLVQAAPAAISLVFSEQVTPAGAGIKVFSPSGSQVAGRVVDAGAVLSASLASAEVGTYVVSWQVLAADTHPSRGAFAFSVGHPSENPYSGLLGTGEAGTSTPLGLALQAIARWIHFIGFALTFGVVAYGALIRRGPAPFRLVAAGLVLLIAAEPLALIAQLASLSFDGDTALAVLGSNFGRLMGLRLGAALLAWTVLATGRSWPVLVIGAADALLDGASAHAIAGLPGVGQVLLAAHAAAMGMWVGGMAGFAQWPDRRFGRYALATLATAVLTGLGLAFAHTHFGASLMTSAYGQALMVKVLVLGAALAALGVRRHRAELVLATLTAGAAALVAALPPPF